MGLRVYDNRQNVFRKTNVILAVGFLTILGTLGVIFLGRQEIFLFVGAFLAELTDSSLGMGFGTTLSPVLLQFSFEPTQVVTTLLIAELLSGLFACFCHHKANNVDWIGEKSARKAALLLGGLSALGAVCGGLALVSIPKALIAPIVGLIILSMGILILRKVIRSTSPTKSSFSQKKLVGLGLTAGFNKAFSGGGYGPLVSSGQILAGVPVKNAIAITSFAEACTCLVGLSVIWIIGGIDFSTIILPIIFGSLISVPLSAFVVKRIDDTNWLICVGLFTVILGSSLLVNAFY